MKKLSACLIAAAGLVGTSAFAADMPVKAPYAPAPAPVYNWTGWYVGVNAGASFGDAKTDFNGAPVTLLYTPLLETNTIPGQAFTDRPYPDGFMGGGQIGYNYQWSPLIVVGIEADFQGSLERDSDALTNTRTVTTAQTGIGLPPTALAALTSVTDYTAKIEWFGTVRGRIGYVWGGGNVMSYLTGGFAYGRVDVEGTNAYSGTFAPNGGTGVFSVTNTFGHNNVNTGWVVGYGTEGVIDFWGARNWTWKIESLYMDLGHLDTTGVTSAVNVAGPPPAFTSGSGGQLTTHTHFTDGILRAGLNYKFY
jgi:outer membrane immunogenic protein